MVTRRAPSAARSFLPISRPLCSTFVHVRRGPGSRPNHGPRSVRGQREHACPHRSRPQRPAQTDRLRQATRHRDSAACRRPRLCLSRQTLRHRRSRGHPRPHHLWPAPRRGPGSRALPARRTRPGPDTNLSPPNRTLPATPPTAGRATRTPCRPTPPRTDVWRACPPRKLSPPRCVAARSALSSSISAATSASDPATATGRSGTNFATPSSPTAAASPVSSTGRTGG